MVGGSKQGEVQEVGHANEKQSEIAGVETRKTVEEFDHLSYCLDP